MMTYDLNLETALRNSSVNLQRLYMDFKKSGVKQDFIHFTETLFKYINGLSLQLESNIFDKLFIDTAKGRWLDVIIYQEMNLKRLNSSEEAEKFRQRALAYFAFIQRGFTNTSVKDFIEIFGYEVVEVVSTFDLGSGVRPYKGGVPLVSKGWLNYITIFHVRNVLLEDIVFLQSMIETVRPRAISKPLIRGS